jgi:tetratricopeptide (TPR) repeat protein
MRAVEQAKVAFELSKSLAREDRLTIEGAYHVAGKQWVKAIDVYHTLYSFFPDRLDYGLNLVDAQVAGGKSHDALVTIAKLRGPGVGDPRIDLAEARAAASLSDFRRAREANARAVEAASKQGASFERAQALQQQCWANRNLGHADEARDAGTRAQVIFQENHNARGEARSLVCIGAVLDDRGDLDGARRMYEKALSLAQGIGARLEIAGSLNNIGNILAAEGKLEEFGLASAGLRLRRKLTTVDQLGPEQHRREPHDPGEFRNAQKAWNLPRLRAIGDQQGSLIVDQSGYRVVVRRRTTASSTVRQRSSHHFPVIRLRADLAYARVGDIQLAKDDLVGAGKSYQESLEIRRQLGEGSMIAAGQLSLATLAVEQGDLDHALPVARDATQQLHELGDTEQEAIARNLLARILLLQKKADLSQAELEAARKLAAKDRTSLMATDIVNAQLLGFKKKPGEGTRLLAHVLERAKATDYALGQMQARLAVGEIQISSSEAVKNLEFLQGQAAKLGFKLLQRRAEELLKTRRLKPVQRTSDESTGNVSLPRA